MVARYLDSSALVRRYVREAGASGLSRLLRADLLCTSRLSALEITSAVARREREGVLGAADRERILGALSQDLERFLLVEVRDPILSRARRLLLHHALRSADALHLASCLVVRDHLLVDVTLVAYDRHLREAATAERIPVLPRRLAAVSRSSHRTAPRRPD
jgi:hypothetical protein